jgi:heme a synthase
MIATASPAFRRFAWLTLALTLAVIVWGAFVRATGSGAGCGDHWPVCNGQIVPRAPSTQTIIEFTHRLTAGISFLAVLALTVWASRSRHAFKNLWSSAKASVALMVVEALLGAMLVKLELVANNATANRAVAMSIHLVTTMLLVAALSSTVFFSRHDNAQPRRLRAWSALEALNVGLLFFVGITGAVAALGDTLQMQGVSSPVVFALIQLRIAHPLVAIASVATLMRLGWQSLDNVNTKTPGLILLRM